MISLTEFNRRQVGLSVSLALCVCLSVWASLVVLLALYCHLYDCLPVRLCAYMPVLVVVYLYVCLSCIVLPVCLSVCMLCLFVCCLLVRYVFVLSMYICSVRTVQASRTGLFVYLCACVCVNCLLACLCICASVCLSACLCVRPYVCLSVSELYDKKMNS